MAVIILEHPSEPFTAVDVSDILADLLSGRDDLVVETLMISFGVVVLQIRNRSPSQRILTKEDHSVQRFVLDGSRESFEM